MAVFWIFLSLEAGNNELSVVAVSIPDVCDRYLTIRKQAKTQGLELVIDIASPVQRFIADEQQLKQMLLNTIKFTSIGKISLIVKKTLLGI